MKCVPASAADLLAMAERFRALSRDYRDLDLGDEVSKLQVCSALDRIADNLEAAAPLVALKERIA